MRRLESTAKLALKCQKDPLCTKGELKGDAPLQRLYNRFACEPALLEPLWEGRWGALSALSGALREALREGLWEAL